MLPSLGRRFAPVYWQRPPSRAQMARALNLGRRFGTLAKRLRTMLTKEVIVPAVNVVGRILKTSDAKAYRHLRPAIDAGFGLALRSSEITGMDWRNVTEKVFHVPASIAKNGKPRNIQRTPLLDGVFRSLHNQHQGALQRNRFWLCQQLIRFYVG